MKNKRKRFKRSSPIAIKTSPHPQKKEPAIKATSGMVRKYELGFRYNPTAPNKRAARDSLKRMINRCTPLLMELAKGYYNADDWYLTPRQVELIYYYLGEPPD